MFFIYTILAHIAFFLASPLLLLHPKLRQGIFKRLGRYPSNWPRLRGSPRIWLHGASAGDLLAIQPMASELKRRLPGCSVLLTTITNSGMAVASKGLVAADELGFLPYDLPWCTNRVMRKVRPDVLILEYAEVWPALIRAAKKVGAKVMITNGRFDERALGRYRLLYALIGNPLKKVNLLCMRSEQEAEHALAIGAPPERTRVTGNTKFDRFAAASQGDGGDLVKLRKVFGLEQGDLVWVAGSTHDGEERLLLWVFEKLRARFASLRMIIAPRYVERVGKIVAMVEEMGMNCGIRSHGCSHDQPVAVLDTVGELSAVYGLADLVFVGGSFVQRGGQNILEPAACAKPVLFGPHMENFADSVSMLLGRGAIQVKDSEQLLNTMVELIEHPSEVDKLGMMARESVLAVQGASRANIDSLVDLLDSSEDGTRHG